MSDDTTEATIKNSDCDNNSGNDSKINVDVDAMADFKKNTFGSPTPTDIIIDDVTTEFIESKGASTLREMGPRQVTIELISLINARIKRENIEESATSADKKNAGNRRTIDKLPFAAVSKLLRSMYTVTNLAPSARNTDPDTDLLAIYDDDPTSPTYGTYQTSMRVLRRTARQFNLGLTTNEFDQIVADLQDCAPRRTRGTDPDLIAVGNGIFDYGTKTLMPFSPEHIFVSKSVVNYRPNPENPVIVNEDDGTEWDVESWMAELSDDPEVVELLWELIGAVVRPYVSWNKSAWFYSERGNNGKGTLVSLMRNLCGEQSYASIPLSDFGKDFMLEPLTRANAILVDENDVGTFIDKAANLKAIITNDVIAINRKFKHPISYQFHGFMIQCLNELPKFRDRSESIYRRQLFIKFDKCFTGAERKYIKDDYLTRDEVLEYVLHRVLHMDYYELSQPETVVQALEEYKEYNDPVRAFWFDLSDQFAWDLLPYTFLHDLYRQWMARAMPTTKPQSRTTFTKSLQAIIDAQGSAASWAPTGARRRPGTAMDAPEDLINEYQVAQWYHPGKESKNNRARVSIGGTDLVRNKQCTGLYRIGSIADPAHVAAMMAPSSDD